MVSYACPPDFSGAALQLWRLALAVREAGVNVTIVAANDGSPKLGEEFVQGIRVVRVPACGPRRWRPLVFAATVLGYLLFHRRECDIVHAHHAAWPALASVLAGRLLGKKSIVKMTLLGDDDPMTIRRRRLGRLRLGVLSLSDVVISLSAELNRSYAESGLSLSKLRWIPNGVDTTRFCPVPAAERQQIRERLGLPNPELLVTYVGVICPRKGVDWLLQAWRLVAQRQHRSLLVLVGPWSGNLSEISESFVGELRSFLRENNMESRVLFVGRRDNVWDYLQASDAFVLPSRAEGLPNTLLEAMACGLPCIATRVGGITDVVTNEVDGLLCEVGDVEKLANQVQGLAEDAARAQRIGVTARSTVERKFSMERVANTYSEMYRELSGGCDDGVRPVNLLARRS